MSPRAFFARLRLDSRTVAAALASSLSARAAPRSRRIRLSTSRGNPQGTAESSARLRRACVAAARRRQVRSAARCAPVSPCALRQDRGELAAAASRANPRGQRGAESHTPFHLRDDLADAHGRQRPGARSPDRLPPCGAASATNPTCAESNAGLRRLDATAARPGLRGLRRGVVPTRISETPRRRKRYVEQQAALRSHPCVAASSAQVCPV